MKKLLFLATIAVASAPLYSLESKSRWIGFVKVKSFRPKVDNVFVRSGFMLAMSGVTALGAAEELSQGNFINACLLSAATPGFIFNAAVELATGSFQDIASHAVDKEADKRTTMAESTIMNALDLW